MTTPKTDPEWKEVGDSMAAAVRAFADALRQFEREYRAAEARSERNAFWNHLPHEASDA